MACTLLSTCNPTMCDDEWMNVEVKITTMLHVNFRDDAK